MKSWIVISYTHGELDYFLIQADTKQEAESKVTKYLGKRTILNSREIKEFKEVE